MLVTAPYSIQRAIWPLSGRHILAQYDYRTVIVYQAYRPSIGHYAVQYQRFGGDFRFGRMSWLKTNFLWMMHRSGWGTKEGQEVTLAVRLKREGFDSILAQAVPSSFAAAPRDLYPSEESWKLAVASSQVRLQWDPDHDPSGAKLQRRAIQLGLRGQSLAHYAEDWLLEIEDVSVFVAKQRALVEAREWHRLITPQERIYRVTEQTTARALGIVP